MRHRRILGENIRAVRKAEGMTEQELARLVAVSATRIRELERGRLNITLDLLAKIAKALRISVNDLTSGL